MFTLLSKFALVTTGTELVTMAASATNGCAHAAGGLAGYGVHDLIEYSSENEIDLGWLSEPRYILNIPEDSPLDHKGIIGAIFAVTFGYTVNAEWARVIAHFMYLVITLPLVMWLYSRKDKNLPGLGRLVSIFDLPVK